MNTATPLIANEISTIYQQVVAHPSRFADLTQYERDCLHEFAEAKTLELVKQAFNTWQKLGPLYDYPEGTTDRARYWLERAPGYAPNERVLALFVAPEARVATATPSQSEGQKTTVPDAPAKPRLSLPELALFLIYTGQTVSRGETANELARKEGYKSGEALYQDYTRLSKRNNRTGFELQTALKGHNMIKAIRNVLPRLIGQQKERAEREILVIQANIL